MDAKPLGDGKGNAWNDSIVGGRSVGRQPPCLPIRWIRFRSNQFEAIRIGAHADEEAEARRLLISLYAERPTNRAGFSSCCVPPLRNSHPMTHLTCDRKFVPRGHIPS